ncbi:hypothetical protein Micbo1qcDRAFT_172543 [Microdochium bolleyi]|uniref:Uncharacterized protein n=1 Tax=Microdochium bolleyi TaxID=196109 RepID=A0A136J8Z3_9PEZI|nr:hypothetical protein Micbo1qcDRAFT_172543 [Microdochium bolleyi]
MTPYKLRRLVVVGLLTASSSAKLNIKNWCSVPTPIGGTFVWKGGEPWILPPNTTTSFDWIADGNGTAIKISKHGIGPGILQFEYTLAADGLYWDMSDLDGTGDGLVCTPFGADNGRVVPTGSGAGAGTCVEIRCAVDEVCLDSTSEVCSEVGDIQTVDAPKSSSLAQVDPERGTE